MKGKGKSCPDCKKRGLAEELLFIPRKEGRSQHLYCAQCDGEYPCDDNGKISKPKRMICY